MLNFVILQKETPSFIKDQFKACPPYAFYVEICRRDSTSYQVLVYKHSFLPSGPAAWYETTSGFDAINWIQNTIVNHKRPDGELTWGSKFIPIVLKDWSLEEFMHIPGFAHYGPRVILNDPDNENLTEFLLTY